MDAKQNCPSDQRGHHSICWSRAQRSLHLSTARRDFPKHRTQPPRSPTEAESQDWTPEPNAGPQSCCAKCSGCRWLVCASNFGADQLDWKPGALGPKPGTCGCPITRGASRPNRFCLRHVIGKTVVPAGQGRPWWCWSSGRRVTSRQLWRSHFGLEVWSCCCDVRYDGGRLGSEREMEVCE